MIFSRERLARVKALFFDLDGTLLKVEMRRFIPAYLDGLATRLGVGDDRRSFRALARGAILELLERQESDGSNRSAFLAYLERHGGIAPQAFERALEDFCADGLDALQPLVEPLPQVDALLAAAFSSGRQVVVATNPVFPRAVIEARIRWGGMAGYPFALISDWQNSRLCKPAPGYFGDLLARLGLAADEVLMIGNDSLHDLAAGHLGITTLLVDTWLVERPGDAPDPDWRGDHRALLEVLRKLP